jgi:hypothetical protein
MKNTQPMDIILLVAIVGFGATSIVKSRLLVSVSGILLSISVLLMAYQLGVKNDRSVLSIDLGDTYAKVVAILLLLLGIVGICFFIAINFVDIKLKY